MVASAGNFGKTEDGRSIYGSITTPGISPFAITVGALNTKGTPYRSDDEVASFSRGMRQRLALERTLLHQPRLVLLDEPFTGLDDRAVRIVAGRIQQVAAAGAIVVMATHDLDLADGLVTRVVLFREGRLITEEPATQGLRERYRKLMGSA